jgi:lactate dehydrogenase-like 2-hydroxyacid dehydrogenase
MVDADILITGPMRPIVMETLAARSRLHRLWEAPDRVGFLREVAPRIRGIATGTSHGRTGAELMDALPNLEIISSFGVGYDNVDVAEAARRGIVVTNTHGVLDEEVADTALGLLLCTVRQFPHAERFVRSGQWLKGDFPLTATLRGRKAGIVGLGRIGKAIARRLEALGLPVSYHGRNPQGDVSYSYYPTVVALAEAVDVLIVITPGGPATKNLIDADVLRALGPDGVLINVARGSVVDEDALIEALRSKTILTAGLDVFVDEPRVRPELLAMDHIVLFPHVGSSTDHTRDAMGQLVVDNLLAWFDGKGPLTPVAETPWPRA